MAHSERMCERQLVITLPGGVFKMKRLAVVVAAVLVVSACQAREEAPETIDTPAVAPAPAPVDTGMMMPDTMMMDTTARP